MVKKIVTCFALLLVCVAGSVSATQAEQSNTAETGKLLPEWEVSTYFSSTLDADFDHSSSSFSKDTFEFKAAYLDFSFFYGRDSYSWDNTSDLNFGTDKSRAPWDSLEQLALRYNSRTKISPRGAFLYGGELASRYEDSVDLDSLSALAYLSYEYQFASIARPGSISPPPHSSFGSSNGGSTIGG